MSSKQQYGTVSRFQSAIGMVLDFKTSKLLGELEWPVLSDRRREACLSLFSKSAGGHSAISLDHAVYLSLRVKHAALITQVLSPSLHELMSTNIRSFHVHFSIGTLCLLKSISSTCCLQASQLIWLTKPYDTPVVKGNAHCWIFAEELKIQPKMH